MSSRELLSGGRIVEPATSALLEMDFPQRLAALRKERALTQDTLADQVGVHVSQLRRYEAGKSQPGLDILRKLAIALSVSADTLVFDKDERGPDDDLRLQFEATTRLTDDEKQTVKRVLEGLLLAHEAKRWAA
jgi:transcriptional regulator with XRE-family HTH domain